MFHVQPTVTTVNPFLLKAGERGERGPFSPFKGDETLAVLGAPPLVLKRYSILTMR